ncbi:hypothetical protein [Synechococcus elongatus]|uniref:Uncharacterized protein n=1 Tax=Synechococcus elongatus PCC 11801 TaxID=2219813 RepID=A0AAQ3MCZ9_SYNEL|nr:hypothetical protein [Synechococcus elongatus]
MNNCELQADRTSAEGHSTVPSLCCQELLLVGMLLDSKATAHQIVLGMLPH